MTDRTVRLERGWIWEEVARNYCFVSKPCSRTALSHQEKCDSDLLTVVPRLSGPKGSECWTLTAFLPTSLAQADVCYQACHLLPTYCKTRLFTMGWEFVGFWENLRDKSAVWILWSHVQWWEEGDPLCRSSSKMLVLRWSRTPSLLAWTTSSWPPPTRGSKFYRGVQPRWPRVSASHPGPPPPSPPPAVRLDVDSGQECLGKHVLAWT